MNKRIKHRNAVKKSFMLFFLLLGLFSGLSLYSPEVVNPDPVYERQTLLDLDISSPLPGSGWEWNTTTPLKSSYSMGDIAIHYSGDIYVAKYVDDEYYTTSWPVLIKYNSQGEEIWNNTWENLSTSFAVGFCGIAIDDDGYIYIGATANSGAGHSDVLLAKCDQDGEILWNKTYDRGFALDELGLDIVLDSNNNIMVLGIALNVSTYTGILMLNYSNEGVLLGENIWAKESLFNGTHTLDSTEIAVGIDIDSDDNLYLAGLHAYMYNNSVVSNVSTILVKFNSSGHYQWDKLWDNGETIYHDTYDVVTDDSNNIYVVGTTGTKGYLLIYDNTGVLQSEVIPDGFGGVGSYSFYSADVAPDGTVFITGSIGSISDTQLLLAQYSNTGDLVWSYSYAVLNEDNIGTGIDVGDDFNIFVCGNNNNKTSTNRSILVLKYHYFQVIPPPEGYSGWMRAAIDGLGSCDACNMVANNSGDVYVAGYYENSSSIYDYGIFLIKYDSGGNQVWNITWDNCSIARYDRIGLDFDSEGFLYMSCFLYNTSHEYFLVKLDKDGNEIWNEIYEAPISSPAGSDIVIDTNDNIYLLALNNSLEGLVDILILKYSKSGTLQSTITWGGNYRYEGPDIYVSYEWGTSIATDNNNIYVTGVQFYNYSTLNYDVLLLKFNESGQCEWNRTWDNDAFDVAYDIAIDEDDIYICGTSGPDQSSGCDAILLTYNSTGHFQEEQFFTLGSHAVFKGIEITSNGKKYLTGIVNQTENHEILLACYSDSGDLIWYDNWGESHDFIGNDIIVNNTDIYLCGELRMYGPSGTFSAILLMEYYCETTPPSVNIFNISDGDRFYPSDSVVIQATISDSSSGISKVQAQILGPSTYLSLPMSEVSGSWVVIWDNNSEYDAGVYTITIWAVDARGNINQTQSVQIRLMDDPIHPPDITIIIIIIIIVLSTIGISAVSTYTIVSRRKTKSSRKLSKDRKISALQGQQPQKKIQLDAMFTDMGEKAAAGHLKELETASKEINIQEETDVCQVHRGPIKGIIFSCPRCKCKYCLKCAKIVEDKNEGCWLCGEPIKIDIEDYVKEGFDTNNLTPRDFLEEETITWLLKEQKLLKALSAIGETSLTVVSRSFLERVESLPWESEFEKLEFFKEMLSLSPEERDEYLSEMMGSPSKTNNNTHGDR